MERLITILGLCALFVLATCASNPALADPDAVAAVGIGLGITRLAVFLLPIGIGGAIFLTLALAGVSYFAIKASKPSDVQDRGPGRVGNVREPITSRKVIYGQARVGGPIAFLHFTDNNNTMHMVVSVAAHEIHSFDAMFVDGQHVLLEEPDATGMRTPVRGTPGYPGVYNNDGDPRYRYHNKLFVETFTGAADQVASANLRAATNDTLWTAEHRGRGIAYFYVRLVYDNATYPTSIPTINFVIKGKKVLDPRTPNAPAGWTDNAALVLLDYLLDPNYGLGAEQTEIDAQSFINAANLADELAIPFDANNRRVIRGSAFNPLTFLFENPTPNQRNGVIPAVDHEGNKSYVNTGDSITRATLSDTRVAGGTIFSGLNLFAISDGAGGFSLATTLANARAGIPITLNAAAQAQAHVSLDNTFGPSEYQHSGELRYTINTDVDTATSPEDVIGDMLTAQAGQLTFTNGRFTLIDSSVPTSTLAIDDDLITSSVLTSPKAGARNYFNTVRGTFLMPQEGWTPVEFKPIKQITPTENRGREKSANIGLPMTISPDMAKRVGELHIHRAREQLTTQITTSMEGMKARVGDVVNVTRSRYGWTNKPFRVIGFQLAPGTETDPIACKLTLREVRTSVQDITDAYILSPSTNLPDAFSGVLPPTGLSVESGNAELSTNGDGTIVVGMRVSWAAPANGFAASYELGHRLHDATPANAELGWTTSFVPSSSLSHTIGNVSDGQRYDIRVRSVSAQGIRSAYTIITNELVDGKREPPPDIAIGEFEVETLLNGTREFTFTQTGWPPDVRVGGGIQIRYSEDLSATWENMLVLRNTFRASPWQTQDLREGAYRFGVKLFDSSNNESVNPFYLRATLGPLSLATSLFRQDEANLGWPGTLGANTTKDGRVLIATGGGSDGTWMDLPTTFTGLPTEWEDIVRQTGSVEYTTQVIDLGASLVSTPRVITISEGVHAVITFKSGNAVSGTGASRVITNPDTQTLRSAIGGSLTTARYIQVSVVVAPDTTTRTNATLDDMQIVLSGDNVEYFYRNLDTGAATGSTPGFTKIANGHFRLEHLNSAASVLRVQETFRSQHDLTFLFVRDVIPVSGAPYAECMIKNASGVLTNANIDVLLVGPRSGQTS